MDFKSIAMHKDDTAEGKFEADFEETAEREARWRESVGKKGCVSFC